MRNAAFRLAGNRKWCPNIYGGKGSGTALSKILRRSALETTASNGLCFNWDRPDEDEWREEPFGGSCMRPKDLKFPGSLDLTRGSGAAINHGMGQDRRDRAVRVYRVLALGGSKAAAFGPVDNNSQFLVRAPGMTPHCAEMLPRRPHGAGGGFIRGG